MRNCDGYTNPDCWTEKVGFIKRCPNALDPIAVRGLRWWADCHRSEWKILPVPGLDFYAQPNPVVEAIRVGESEYQKVRDKP